MPSSLNLVGVFTDAIAEHLTIIRQFQAQQDALGHAAEANRSDPSGRSREGWRLHRGIRRRSYPGPCLGRPRGTDSPGRGRQHDGTHCEFSSV